MSGELCAKLSEAVDASSGFVVPHRIDRARAASIATDAIHRGVLRPADIRGARIEPPHLAYVPFWRVEVAVDGMHVSFPIRVSSQRGASFPIPMPGFRHRESVSLVIARKLFPFPPSHVERTKGRVFSGSTTHGGWSGVEIRLEDMVPWSEHSLPSDVEVVEADTGRAEAERCAGQRAAWSTRPDDAVYATYRPEVRSAALVFYPLHVVRYAYTGHASASSGDTFWVTVCGRHGTVVGGHHPSPLRAVAHKIRKLVTFGG